MTKTEIDIERDFYTLIKNSALGASLRGTLYRSEMRPANADAEDLIVKFLGGLDEQVQTGTIVLNLYVPDIDYQDGRKVADKTRIGELQRLILDFVETCATSEYLIATDGTPYTMLNEQIEQHLIIARIKFKRITN